MGHFRALKVNFQFGQSRNMNPDEFVWRSTISQPSIRTILLSSQKCKSIRGNLEYWLDRYGKLNMLCWKYGTNFGRRVDRNTMIDLNIRIQGLDCGFYFIYLFSILFLCCPIFQGVREPLYYTRTWNISQCISGDTFSPIINDFPSTEFLKLYLVTLLRDLKITWVMAKINQSIVNHAIENFSKNFNH